MESRYDPPFFSEKVYSIKVDFIEYHSSQLSGHLYLFVVYWAVYEEMTTQKIGSNSICCNSNSIILLYNLSTVKQRESERES